MKLAGIELGLNPTTLAIGAGAFLLGPMIVAAAGGVLRSAAKAGIKGGMVAYNRGKLLTEEAKESWDDLSAEAKAEMEEPQPTLASPKKRSSKAKSS
jgi:hypothetical protein